MRRTRGPRYRGGESPGPPSRERVDPGKADTAPKAPPGSRTPCRSSATPHSATRTARPRSADRPPPLAMITEDPRHIEPQILRDHGEGGECLGGLAARAPGPGRCLGLVAALGLGSAVDLAARGRLGLGNGFGRLAIRR